MAFNDSIAQDKA